jgi:hypothetical protein
LSRKLVFGFLLNSKFVQFLRVERSSTQHFTYEYTTEAPVVHVEESDDGEASAGDTSSEEEANSGDAASEGEANSGNTASGGEADVDSVADSEDDTDSNDTPLGLLWLSSFFAADSTSLGFQAVNNPFGRRYHHDTLLGHGVSARVYSVRDHPKMVIKLYRKAEAEHEASVLTKLKSWKVPHVPRLIELDKKRKVGLLLRPRANSLIAGQFSRKHAEQALHVLEQVHTKGFVHRDIHPGNLLQTKGGNILINDWGFAVPTGEKLPYRGTFIHASDTVLGHIRDGEAEFVVSPADDLVSLVRTAYVLTQAGATVSIPGIDKEYPSLLAQRIIDGWTTSLPEYWRNLQNLAQECDYAALCKGLQAILP